MNRTFLLGGLASALFVQSLGFAAADSCDDYFQRHYTADLVPLSAYTEQVPRSGDITGYDTLNVRVKNMGNQPIQFAGSGGFPANAFTLGMRRAGHRRPPTANLTQFYQTSLPVPMAAGATRVISVTIPQDSIANCAKLRITVDARRQANQHGCNVFGNDGEDLVVQRKGKLNCSAILLPHP